MVVRELDRQERIRARGDDLDGLRLREVLAELLVLAELRVKARSVLCELAQEVHVAGVTQLPVVLRVRCDGGDRIAEHSRQLDHRCVVDLGVADVIGTRSDAALIRARDERDVEGLAVLETAEAMPRCGLDDELQLVDSVDRGLDDPALQDPAAVQHRDPEREARDPETREDVERCDGTAAVRRQHDGPAHWFGQEARLRDDHVARDLGAGERRLVDRVHDRQHRGIVFADHDRNRIDAGRLDHQRGSRFAVRCQRRLEVAWWRADGAVIARGLLPLSQLGRDRGAIGLVVPGERVLDDYERSALEATRGVRDGLIVALDLDQLVDNTVRAVRQPTCIGERGLAMQEWHVESEAPRRGEQRDIERLVVRALDGELLDQTVQRERVCRCTDNRSASRNHRVSSASSFARRRARFIDLTPLRAVPRGTAIVENTCVSTRHDTLLATRMLISRIASSTRVSDALSCAQRDDSRFVVDDRARDDSIAHDDRHRVLDDDGGGVAAPWRSSRQEKRPVQRRNQPTSSEGTRPICTTIVSTALARSRPTTRDADSSPSSSPSCPCLDVPGRRRVCVLDDDRDAARRTRRAIGEEHGYSLNVAEFSALGVTTPDFMVNVFDLDREGFDGLLGMNFFWHFNFEVRPNDRQIIVELISGDWSPIVNEK